MTGQQLVVKMNFNDSGQGTKRKRRKTKSLSKANKNVKTLEVKIIALDSRNATRKKVQRLKDRAEKSQSKQTEVNTPVNRIPRSRAMTKVNNLNMTPKSRRIVRKQLVFKNCLVGDAESSAMKTKGKAKQRTVLSVVCGKLINKYRMGRQMSSCLGVNKY
jgi:hypothetical protein